MLKIPRQQLDWIINDTFSSVPIDETLAKIGKDGISRREFNDYLKANPDFEKEYTQAELEACRFIENDILNVHKGIPVKDKRWGKLDDKAMRVKLEAMKKILEYRNPAKYSPKVDLNLNGTVSVKHSLEQANARVAAVFGIKAVNDSALGNFDLPSELEHSTIKNISPKK